MAFSALRWFVPIQGRSRSSRRTVFDNPVGSYCFLFDYLINLMHTSTFHRCPCSLIIAVVSTFTMSCSHTSAPTDSQSVAKIVFSRWTVDLIDVPAFIRSTVESSWVENNRDLKYSSSDDSNTVVFNSSFSPFDLGHDTTVTLTDSLVGFNMRRYSTISGNHASRVDTVCIDTRNHFIRYLSIDSTWNEDGGSHQAGYALVYSWRNIPYLVSANGSLSATLRLDSVNSFQMGYSESRFEHWSASANSRSGSQLIRVIPPTSSSRIVIRMQ